ncbi:acyl-CoA dehydrogenase [Streptoalloteichus tenebrarius]|uniref:Acyl-CoA dehydrogenase n=1 Tax=Streptoalloteichus tenebrarius (strain ATCC 17920 / DSM 40477 / JCM 4838 / CBS 697.72 / NBRC 16177 / NCIMB 11028 / NRRL B-12390 / A12253. 1 / ISP 5477) TaxID=1933 RepID=A0ABT1HYQ0_STRSD|nr:acyl-CoA dehydrogenase family protein [Streptoalloteichus tenebrarius]MCP2260658.1 acyl-CoA dehydrogenase [Streptoalloteichus tenebrarius]BFF03812.1 acyl-CoA dehydrogenase family protein [Streptoalloteichus tenebrarius]
MINLEVPKKFAALVHQAHQVATEIFRPHSRRYDREEHTYPTELDMLAAVLDGMNASGEGGAGATGVRRERTAADGEVRNGSNLATVLGTIELCWGDVGLLLALPRQGLGNAAIASVANDEQLERFRGRWAAMAITEPDCGSDSAAIRTTAVLDGDHYVLNGEKIFVTSGERADAVVVWATLDRDRGRAAIKSFVVEKGTPGFELVRLERKLGIRASDTAHFRLDNVRVPKENLLGSPEIDVERGFAGVMQTFDNTRPLVAAMAVGLARAALDETRRLLEEAGVVVDYDRPAHTQPAAASALLSAEADWEAAHLLTLEAAWMADNHRPNSLQASMAKAKAGRVATEITLRCVELCGTLGYAEHTLLEKWARDAKILDIFEGTQQIQQLIVARRLLGKSSQELK